MSALLVPSRDAAPIEQAVIVTSARWDSWRATCGASKEPARDGFARAGAVRAWLGSNGFAPARTRRQNSGQTRRGVRPALGVRPWEERVGVTAVPPHHPAQLLALRSARPYTYNVLQTKRIKSARWRDDGQWSERLWITAGHIGTRW